MQFYYICQCTLSSWKLNMQTLSVHANGLNGVRRYSDSRSKKLGIFPDHFLRSTTQFTLFLSFSSLDSAIFIVHKNLLKSNNQIGLLLNLFTVFRCWVCLTERPRAYTLVTSVRACTGYCLCCLCRPVARGVGGSSPPPEVRASSLKFEPRAPIM